MTRNETLREMLTERGAEWEAFDDFEQTTQWSTYNGAFVYWSRERDGKLLVETTAPTKCSASCTPAQAIEITLGRGTCHMEKDFRWWDDDLGWLTSYTCSVCGESVILMSDRKPSCCANCGRRVTEVDE